MTKTKSFVDSTIHGLEFVILVTGDCLLFEICIFKPIRSWNITAETTGDSKTSPQAFIL